MGAKVSDIQWRMKNREMIRLGDMSVTHIRRCIAMLMRSCAKYEEEIDAASSYSGNGEMAQMEAESSANHYANMLRIDRKWVRVFQIELRMRSGASEQIEIMQKGQLSE